MAFDGFQRWVGPDISQTVRSRLSGRKQQGKSCLLKIARQFLIDYLKISQTWIEKWAGLGHTIPLHIVSAEKDKTNCGIVPWSQIGVIITEESFRAQALLRSFHCFSFSSTFIFPFSERKDNTAVKNCLKFVCLSYPIRNELFCSSAFWHSDRTLLQVIDTQDSESEIGSFRQVLIGQEFEQAKTTFFYFSIEVERQLLYEHRQPSSKYRFCTKCSSDIGRHAPVTVHRSPVGR